jgi:hypothetical protein
VVGCGGHAFFWNYCACKDVAGSATLWKGIWLDIRLERCLENDAIRECMFVEGVSGPSAKFLDSVSRKIVEIQC